MSLLLAAKLLKRKDQEFIENFLTAESLFSLILHQKYCELNPLDIHGVIGFIKIFN